MLKLLKDVALSRFDEKKRFTLNSAMMKYIQSAC